MNHTRRDLAVLLPVFLAAAKAAETNTLPSKTYDYKDLPVKTNPKTGGESRQVSMVSPTKDFLSTCTSRCSNPARCRIQPTIMNGKK